MSLLKSAMASSVHPKYQHRKSQWDKCRDCFEGSDVIKLRGQKYLPKLSGQTDEEYAKYKFRALFYGITSKSLQAIVGMAMSADCKIEYPEGMKQYFEGSKLNQFSEVYTACLQEVLLQSRVAVFIDFNDLGEPNVVTYVAEDITSWHVDANGATDFVSLREVYDDFNDDYTVEQLEQYRELRIVNGVYIQKIHNESGINELTPTFASNKLTEIPFYVIHPTGLGFADVKPLMLDIAEVNLSHYLSSADLEHGRHFTGLPTPVVIGGEMDGPLHIGSTKFLVIPHKQGDAKYLEFTGQGLQSLEKAMSEKQGLLASMSARLLDNSARGSEAADAVKLRYTSETASLKTVVKAIELALNLAYKKVALFCREDPNSVKISLGTDFMESVMSAADMTSLFNGYLGGAVSKNTLVYNLRKGRRLNPLVSDIDELNNLPDLQPKGV